MSNFREQMETVFGKPVEAGSNVVALPVPAPNPGNGAREAFTDVLSRVAFVGVTYDKQADYILGLLWETGFKIVPIENSPK